MKQIVFLRAVNVGGRNKIKMADLKKSLEDEGFFEVVTYIQSGNIILTPPSSVEGDLSRTIESLIWNKFSLEIRVFSYPLSVIKNILSSCPFDESQPDPKGNLTYFTFCEANREDAESLIKFVRGGEELVYSEKGLWLYCPGGCGRTKLSNSFMEKKLNVPATTRNRKTIEAVIRLSEE